MGLREFVEKLDKEGKLVKINKTVSKKLEASGVLKALDGKPVLFEKIKDSEYKTVGNIFSDKKLIANYFGVKPEELVQKMIKAIENPSEPEIVNEGSCQEVIEDPDLDKLPILSHCEKDGGPYVSAGVIIVNDKKIGQNVSYHRGMQISKNEFVLRILQRHLNEFIEKNGGEIDAAYCIGLGANVGLAASTSVGLGVNELTIANSLKPLKIVKCKTIDVYVPADCEIVLEGKITKKKHVEGPFVDLTETYDIVRDQLVFEVKKITHRKNPIYQALLPGALEHKILMGMPREPTIFKEVNKVCKCIDVSINPGGCSWLHAIVKIDKVNEDDGKKAIEAAFAGHKSLKHVFVVDSDIDIFNHLDVEWAMATRFQGDRDVIVKEGKGSSLDPSADPKTRATTKMGFDLTKPLVAKGKNFEKAEFPKVNLKDYIE